MNLWEIGTRDENTTWDIRAVREMLEGNAQPDVVKGIFDDWINTQMLLSDLLAILPVNLMLVDELGKVLAVTPKMLREVWHCKADDVRGRYLSLVMSDYLRDEDALLPLMSAVVQGEQWRGEIELNDGRLAGVRTCALPLGNERVSVIMLDILAENDENVWWRRLMRSVDESRELVTRGRISGGVMHDVKNMIQNLSGNVQCMELKTPPNDKLRVRLEMMSHQIVEMSQLINSYLQMGQQDMQTGEYAVNELVESTIGLMNGSARMQRIELVADLQCDLPGLRLDATRIKQVLMNCIENSMDAIVEKRSALPQDDRSWGEIVVRTFITPDGDVAISVEDDGAGLSAEQENHLFEPFFTTKDGGHGIGMSFSRAVVELHGGTMEAENRAEGGCRATISLPVQTRLCEEAVNFYDEMACLDW